MLVTLDLTERQAARVLAQAVRTRAKLEIEPRPEGCVALLWGSFARREGDLLQVDLQYSGLDAPLTRLIGAMCDARTILSGQLCMFSTVILDAVENVTPRRLLLRVPDVVQVANRRRFVRKALADPVHVRILVPGQEQPVLGHLANIGASGLGCRAKRADLEDVLFIGDALEIEFALPWTGELYRLPAAVCSKTPCPDHEQVLVGFEFLAADQDPSALQHLRDALNDEAARLIEMDGDA